MREIEMAMLWEKSDAGEALGKRFKFDTPDAAARWVTETLRTQYGIEVTEIQRLVISAANLMAWCSSDQGPVLAKCCALPELHERLSALAELTAWLSKRGVPVAVPLLSHAETQQIRHDHLTLSVLPVVEGALLDTTQDVQIHAAGVALGQIHRALTRYPADPRLGQSEVTPLAERMGAWSASVRDPEAQSAITQALDALDPWLANTPSVELPAQLLHNDYRAANILWRDGRIRAILDFEELDWGNRVSDLAHAATHLATRFHTWGPLPLASQALFIAGYQLVNPLNEDELHVLPALLVLQSVRLAQAASGHDSQAACLEAVTAAAEQLVALSS